LTERGFRLGSTSYVYWDDILPNVRQLGPFVDDVELVLFESDGYGNLPDQAVVTELQRQAAIHDLTYTVHLPLGLKVAPGERSLLLAHRIVELTRPLEPFAYIVHLDAQEALQTGRWEPWRESSTRGLEDLGRAVGGMERLCIENLERWPYEEMLPILERIPVSFCLDIGHLWLQRLDPVPCIERLAPRMRVVHLHGVAERDHRSLSCVPRQQLHAVLEALASTGFAGVLTLEVFSVEDFFPSRQLVLKWTTRHQNNGERS